MNDNKLKSLAPSYEGDNIGIYDDYITNALNEKLVSKLNENEVYELKNRNIAITGSYGSGKSTVIKTYFHNHPEYEVVYVSLGSYVDKGKQSCSNKDENSTMNISVTKNGENKTINIDENEISKNNTVDINEVEIGIIQQIIYTEDIHKLKNSRILRIDWTKEEKNRMYSQAYTFILSIIVFIGLFNILRNIDELNAFIKNWSFLKCIIYLKNNIIQINAVILVVILISFIITYYCDLLAKAIYKIRMNYHPNKISLTAGIASIDVEDNEIGKTQFVMNKYIDELIYFFKNTDNSIVVFEDLDRLDDKLKLFNKLKEINMIINNALKGKTVQFIYAVNDSIFEDSEQRTKFFDIIIPILPYSSSGNVKDLLQVILQKELKFDKWKNIANDLYTYIDNARVLYDIENEYKVYLNNLEDNSKKEVNEKQEVDKDNRKQLLYLCAYKVLYPLKFAQLERGKGRIAYYFSFSFERNSLDWYTTDLNNKIQELEKQKELLVKDNEQYADYKINLLKDAIIKSFNTSESQLNNIMIYYYKDKIKTQLCSVKDFIENPLKYIDIIEKYDIVFRHGRDLPSDKIFSFTTKEQFCSVVKLKDKNEKSMDAEINNIRNKINSTRFYNLKIHEKIKYLKDNPITQEYILDEDKVKNKDDINNLKKYELNNFEEHMLSANILKANCIRLIGLKHNSSLTVKDENTCIAIKGDRVLDNVITIDNVDKLIDALSEEDFSRDSICIEDILIFVLKNEGYENHIRYFFTNFTDKKINTLFSILERNNELFKSVTNYVNDIWNLISSDKYEKYRELAALLTIIYVDDSMLDEVSYFYIYISNTQSFFKTLNKNFKDISDELSNFNFDFTEVIDFDISCKKMIKWAYQNNRFRWCINHIEGIFLAKNYNFDKNKIISSIKLSNDSILNNSMIDWCNTVVDMLFTETKGQEDDENHVITFIKSPKLDNEHLEKLLKIESVKFKNIKNIGHYELLQRLDKIDINFENLNTIFEANGNEISDYIKNSVEKNIKKLLQENIEYKQYEQFFRKLLIKIDINTFKKIVNKLFVERHYLAYQESFTTEKNEYLIDKGMCYSKDKDNIEATLNTEKLSRDYKVKYIRNCMNKTNIEHLKTYKLKFFVEYSDLLEDYVIELLQFFGKPYCNLLKDKVESIPDTPENEKLINILLDKGLIDSKEISNGNINITYKEKELINA